MNIFDSQDLRDAIIQAFPGLINDTQFKVTSPETDDYNCIAWAANRTNAFWWPSTPQPDGTYWPIEDKSEDFGNLVNAYASIGYVSCTDWIFEPKFKKIALYIDQTTGKFTHASRQLRSGLWTSKLGLSFDIVHSTPYTIENDLYGIVNGFMKIVF